MLTRSVVRLSMYDINLSPLSGNWDIFTVAISACKSEVNENDVLGCFYTALRDLLPSFAKEIKS